MEMIHVIRFFNLSRNMYIIYHNPNAKVKNVQILWFFTNFNLILYKPSNPELNDLMNLKLGV